MRRILNDILDFVLSLIWFFVGLCVVFAFFLIAMSVEHIIKP